MDENKIEQVEAQAEVEAKAEDVAVEAPAEEVVETPVAEEAEAEEAVEEVEAPAEEAVEAPAEEAEVQAEEVVAEGCEAGETCKPKKETEDDEEEKKVAVKEGAEEAEAEQAEEVEESENVLEQVEDLASLKVADIVMETLNSLPIEEGISEEETEAKKQSILENGERVLACVMRVLEAMVNGCTVELNGHQVEVKDFVGTGGKVNMGLPAGINPPCKSEDDESEKKVTIQAYHESAEEIDYKAKFAESEALMNDVVSCVETTSAKYTELVEKYNEVVVELQSYKLSEAYSITVDDAANMLANNSFDEVCEALEEAEAKHAGEEVIVEAEEEVEDKAEDKEEAEEKKEDKKEEKKEEEQEKALEEIKESVEGAVISESVEVVAKPRVYSVFASTPIVESKKAKKAYSVFADQ